MRARAMSDRHLTFHPSFAVDCDVQNKRELVKEQEKEEKEEAAKERKRELMLDRRKRETRNLVAEEIRKESEAHDL